MNSANSVSKSQERRSAWFWSGFVLALMTVNLLIAAIAIIVAIGDPTFEPVPSYGENGVDWDTRKRLQARSDSLGWTALVQRVYDPNGIHLLLTDSLGQRVTGASGTVQAYHFTRAGRHVTVPAIESDTIPGLYMAKIDTSKDGRWHVTARLTRNQDEDFLWDHDVEWYR